MTGLPLFDHVYAPAKKADPLRERWERFHKDNPHVLTLLIQWAQEEIEAGENRVSIKWLWEKLRKSKIQIQGGEFRCDNRLHPLAARAMIARDSRLEKYIELRRRPSEGR